MQDILASLGLDAPALSGVYADGWVDRPGGGEVESHDPATGRSLARVGQASLAD